jgi:hypothetical protein
MSMSPYAPMRVTQVGNPSFNDLVSDDLYAIIAKISDSAPFHTFSIHAADAQIQDSPNETRSSSDDKFSIWARYGSIWRFAVIGAISLGDTFFELADALQNSEADEIRICPPGCPEPGKLD